MKYLDNYKAFEKKKQKIKKELVKKDLDEVHSEVKDKTDSRPVDGVKTDE